MTTLDRVAGLLRIGIRQRERPGARPARADRNPAQRYFTDGVRLYRLVCWVSRSVNAKLAALEDCRSLEIVLIRGEDLARGALRPVLPATGSHGRASAVSS